LPATRIQRPSPRRPPQGGGGSATREKVEQRTPPIFSLQPRKSRRISLKCLPSRRPSLSVHGDAFTHLTDPGHPGRKIRDMGGAPSASLSAKVLLPLLAPPSDEGYPRFNDPVTVIFQNLSLAVMFPNVCSMIWPLISFPFGIAYPGATGISNFSLKTVSRP
jgi:hypothetical protein